jgi:hypothetical protein
VQRETRKKREKKLGSDSARRVLQQRESAEPAELPSDTPDARQDTNCEKIQTFASRLQHICSDRPFPSKALIDLAIDLCELPSGAKLLGGKPASHNPMFFKMALITDEELRDGVRCSKGAFRKIQSAAHRAEFRTVAAEVFPETKEDWDLRQAAYLFTENKQFAANGFRLQIAGLVGRADLNGMSGIVQSFDATKGRYVMAIDGTGTDTVRVKPTNLTYQGANISHLEEAAQGLCRSFVPVHLSQMKDEDISEFVGWGQCDSREELLRVMRLGRG